MRQFTLLCAALLLTLCFSSMVQAATVIDFGPGFGAPATDADLTNQLQAYGVTFSSAGPNPVQWHGTNPVISSYSYCISGGWDTGALVTAAIRVDFDPYVIEASIRGFDGGNDLDVLALRAYDSGGNLVDSDDLTSQFGEPGSVLSVIAPEIAYMTFEVFKVDSGLFFDDLTFTPIPEPASLALLALGGLVIRKRK